MALLGDTPLFTNDQLTGFGGALEIGSVVGGLMGTSKSVQGSKEKAAAEKQIAQLEIQSDAVRRKAMEFSARRQMLQTVRQAQQAKAIGLANAVNQGAQFSSGLAGGYGSISGQASTQQVGVLTNLGFGENIFDINAQIDKQKMAEADAETKIAEGQGQSSMFGSIGKAVPSIISLASLL